jgi:hypothetical protein
MVTPPIISNRPPLLTIEDLNDDLNYLPIPQDILQLQVDTLNVYENRISIDTFPPEYQQRIMGYYRFSATRYNSDTGKIAARTEETLDIL